VKRIWEACAWRFVDDDYRIYSDAYVEQQRDSALQNVDLNTASFAHLDPAEFETRSRPLGQSPLRSSP